MSLDRNLVGTLAGRSTQNGSTTNRINLLATKKGILAPELLLPDRKAFLNLGILTSDIIIPLILSYIFLIIGSQAGSKKLETTHSLFKT